MFIFAADHDHRIYFRIGSVTDHFGMHRVSERLGAHSGHCIHGVDVYVAGGISSVFYSEGVTVHFSVKSDGTDHHGVSRYPVL